MELHTRQVASRKNRLELDLHILLRQNTSEWLTKNEIGQVKRIVSLSGVEIYAGMGSKHAMMCERR